VDEHSQIPQSILIALILLLTMVGAYAINNSMLDLIVLIVMGLVGYLFRKINFDVAPLVVALVLGPMLETMMRESLYISLGDPTIFFTRPISERFCNPRGYARHPSFVDAD